MNQLLNFLKSPSAVMFFLALALTAQVPHAAVVFARIAHDANGETGMDAYLYAIALEGLILLFVVNGWHPAAWLFAVVSIAINICYYYPATDFWAKLLVAVAIPLAIALDSHLVKSIFALRLKQEEEAERRQRAEAAEAERKAEEAERKAEEKKRKAEEYAAAQAAILAQEQIRLAAETKYTCAVCGVGYPKSQQLAAHTKYCIKK